MSVLNPFSHALATVISATHAGLAAAGADPASGTTWVVCIAAVVVLVRLALLPLVIHGVRQAHAAARARPQLEELTRRYRGRRDPDDLRAYAAERRRIAAEHDMSRLGCLPVLVQLPIWVSLYHLLLLSFVAQKYLVAPNTVLGDVPEAMTRVQHLMPAISATGLIVAGSAVPLALLVYWVCNSAWTLGQSAVVFRWFPTPGSAAAQH